MPRAPRAGILLACVLAVTGTGCSNAFLTSYQGDRYPETGAVAVVAEQPKGSGLIGTSSFVAGTGFGEPEAVTAARAVGADAVQWGKGLDLGSRPAGEGVVSSSLTPVPPTSSWSPVQPGGQLYRYVARYFRTGAADSKHAGALAEVPAERGSDAQLIEDAAAATKEASGR